MVLASNMHPPGAESNIQAHPFLNPECHNNDWHDYMDPLEQHVRNFMRVIKRLYQ